MLCDECHNKKGTLRTRVSKILCKDCNLLDKYVTITKTDSKRNYLLTDEDLETLDEYVAKCPYGMATYYLRDQVLELASIKYNCEINDVDDKIQEIKMKKIEDRDRRKQTKQNKRKEKLINELNKVGLTLRDDSVLYQNYIDGDDSKELKWIVYRMCQMKYLFEYCNMEDWQYEAYDKYCEIRDAGYFPDFRVFDKAEEIALNKYSNGKYPKVFPWLVNDNLDV